MGFAVAGRAEAIGKQAMSPKLWDVSEVAEFLGLAVGTVYHLLSQKRLPCVRISGRCVRFDPRQIEEWVAQRTEEPEAK
jgi:excisionase family DNA binding protein